MGIVTGHALNFSLRIELDVWIGDAGRHVKGQVIARIVYGCEGIIENKSERVAAG